MPSRPEVESSALTARWDRIAMTEQDMNHPTQGRRLTDQNRLLLDLPLVDHRMMRLWESLKWSLGMRKGSRRELIRNSKMLKKLQQEKLVKW